MNLWREWVISLQVDFEERDSVQSLTRRSISSICLPFWSLTLLDLGRDCSRDH